MTDAALAGAPAAGVRRPRLLPWAPLVTLALLIGPVAAGTLGALAPSVGLAPWRGDAAPAFGPWRDLLAWPGFADAARLSLVTGLGATAASFALTVLIFAAFSGTRAFRAVERALAPMLAAPHAAVAFGLAFLIAPSGWIARALSPWATGWARPPDLLLVNDPAGLALMAGLVLKETPFLCLMTLAALGQTDWARELRAARSLGYGRVAAWLTVVAPQVYPQIRLPVYAALAYAASTVDMAIILGPTTPPTLAVQALIWTNDPDLTLRLRAAAAATAQLLLVFAALRLWRIGEAAAGRGFARVVARGRRGRRDGPLRVVAGALGVAAAAAAGLGLAGLGVWSVAGFWSFPDALPDAFTLRAWTRHAPRLVETAAGTTLVALGATALGLFLALACLEAEERHGLRRTARSLPLLYLPLLVPQLSFLLGLQTLMTAAGIDGGRLAVILAHAVFTTPYVFLSLADPWRAWDRRFAVAARSLGAGPDRVLWAVRLPMMLRPVLTAAAVGFAVSVAQYLPTLLIGGGRVSTVTTEAVALASGGDRRAVAVFALAQTAAALLGFAVALAVPALAHRNRRGLRPG